MRPDLAQHYLVKSNVTALRRVRKTDNNRVARATGATIVNRVEDLQDSDVGTRCGLFEISKIGDEYFTFLTQCQDAKACTIMLRGPSKDILNEIERNLHDAMAVARNVVFHPRLSPGGGATEMAVSVRLANTAKGIEGVQQWPYRAVAEAMEVIPRTLIQNAGANPLRVLAQLRAKHAEGAGSAQAGQGSQSGGGSGTWGINGETGVVVDMRKYGVWEPEAVKSQSIKTAIEVCHILLSSLFAHPSVTVSPHSYTKTCAFTSDPPQPLFFVFRSKNPFCQSPSMQPAPAMLTMIYSPPVSSSASTRSAQPSQGNKLPQVL